jgi:hypothetical protein
VKVIFTIVTLLCKRVDIDSEALYQHFVDRKIEPSARLVRTVEVVQQARQQQRREGSRITLSLVRKTTISGTGQANDASCSNEDVSTMPITATPRTATTALMVAGTKTLYSDFDTKFCSHQILDRGRDCHSSSRPSTTPMSSLAECCTDPTRQGSDDILDQHRDTWQPELKLQIPHHGKYQVGDVRKIFDTIDCMIQDLDLSLFDLKDFFARV